MPGKFPKLMFHQFWLICKVCDLTTEKETCVRHCIAISAVRIEEVTRLIHTIPLCTYLLDICIQLVHNIVALVKHWYIFLSFLVTSLKERLFRVFFSQQGCETYSLSKDHRFEKDYINLGISKNDILVRVNELTTRNKTEYEVQMSLLEKRQLMSIDVLPDSLLPNCIEMKDIEHEVSTLLRYLPK